MSHELVGWVDSYWVKIIGFVASLLSIWGIVVLRKKSRIKNKLKNVKVGGDYTGGDHGEPLPEKQKIENDLKNSSIDGSYVGGSKKK